MLLVKPQLLLPWLFSLVLALHLCAADVGTAAFYGYPYTPTACYGRDVSQFPGDNLFAAVGEGIWDNGASCGREYLVRCLSAPKPGKCVEGRTIRVRVVDRASRLVSTPSKPRTTMVLSPAAFDLIANRSSSRFINVEFKQL